MLEQLDKVLSSHIKGTTDYIINENKNIMIKIKPLQKEEHGLGQNNIVSTYSVSNECWCFMRLKAKLVSIFPISLQYKVFKT